MENTVAFSYLMDLIEVIGSLFTTQFIFGFSIKSFMLFTLFCITGGLILVSISIIVSSLSFLFGNTEIYNPWSVINYITKGCIPQAYWVNTGKNEVNK